MTMHDTKMATQMPPRAPLPMPLQDFSKPFRDPQSRPMMQVTGTSWFRLATFLPAAATTMALVAIIMDWFRKDGFVAIEIAMMALVGFSAFWIALSVASSTIGLFFAREANAAKAANSTDAMDVALLIPVYNEDPDAVFGRLQAMREDLEKSTSHHRFGIFLLSDTRDEAIAFRETNLFDKVRLRTGSNIDVFYRRREHNTERKTGNIRDWIESWGADWDAFVTLDADSLMAASSILRLSDEMAANQQAGLIQTVPRLIGANSIFSRVQQFANNIYGGALARGLDRWSGNEGNYWGHNAIIRTRAFAACAGLPILRGNGALGGTIKSHDFVEAALLRRAGWSVRLLPDLTQSYEETPQTIIDYVLRDRRWCQGNLQHLRLLFSSGFSAASRFHMLQGAMAYIASVVWFGLLVVWALMGRGKEESVFRYFAETNPLFPQWPEIDTVSRMVVLAFMLGLLLTPKLMGMALTVSQDPSLLKVGGPFRFFANALCEIVLSFVLAPILMVQHVSAVTRTVLGRDTGWTPQNRGGNTYSFAMLARFHWLETVVGLLLVIGISAGIVSLWLVPIAASLASSIFISHLFSKNLSRRSALAALMETEERRAPPQIITACYA
ncbi:MAG: glucans biosynthesis glucosyltransferase MdoH [Rhizobiaceae bacterium]|nr:glucans biosynthesis glucosyltransferase MdoH [Rhizobiaceae bacterium]